VVEGAVDYTLGKEARDSASDGFGDD